MAETTEQPAHEPQERDLDDLDDSPGASYLPAYDYKASSAGGLSNVPMDDGGARLGSVGGGYRSIGFLLALVFILHVPSLFSSFIIDDYIYVYRVHKTDWADLGQLVTTPTLDEQGGSTWWTPEGTLPFYRPIGELSFLADCLLWGTHPFGYHLTNLILHMLCTWLAWRLALRLFGKPSYALLTAAIFALHPIHTEAVIWISGRFDLLVCLGLLCSTLSYLNWTSGRSGSWCWGTLSVLMFLLALGCKETALVLPVVLLAMEWLHKRSNHRVRLAWMIVVFGLVAVIYLGVRWTLFGEPIGSVPPPYGLDKSSAVAAATNIAWNLFQYSLDFVLFLPIVPMNAAKTWQQYPSIILIFMFLVIVAVLVTVALARRTPSFRVGAAWLMLFMAPPMLAMPGERNVYAAGVGSALILATALKNLSDHFYRVDVMRRLVQALMLLWLVIGAVEQVGMWSLARASDKILDDLQTFLPQPQSNTRIYVANMSPLNSVGFTEAIRLRYHRDDLSGLALTLSPTFTATSYDDVIPIAPDTIRIERHGRVFFESFFEQFHLFAEPVTNLPTTARRCGIELLDPPTSFSGLSRLTFRLPYPLNDPRTQILIWDNSSVQSPIDTFKMFRLSHLVPAAQPPAGQ